MRLAPLFIVLACAVAASAADRELPVIGALTTEPPVLQSSCGVGNVVSSTTYSGWWSGYEAYARLVDATTGVCGCGVGVSVRAVHMKFLVPAGASLSLQARLLEADVSGGDCAVPGRDLAWSAPIMVVGGTADSLRDVAVPCDFVCAEVGTKYFIVVDFMNAGAEGLQLVGGGEASSCVTFNDWGGGWVDLVGDMGFLDDLSIWADLDCCYEAVGRDRTTWGALKSSFR